MKLPLNLKNILIDIIIAVVAGVIQLYMVFVIFMTTQGFFICGNEYLAEWKNALGGFVIFLTIFIVELLFTLKYYKSRTWILTISCWLITLSTLLPVITLGLSTLDYDRYYQEFDSEKWKSTKEKPLRMIRTFYDDKRFIGKTREEVVKELGEGEEHWRTTKYELYYSTDGYESPLIFTFRNNLVYDYYLSCYD